MPTLDKILERKKEVSGQVSAQTRASALGLLAISWALLTAHDDPLKKMAANANHYATLGMAVLGSLVLACDLLQYVAYTRVADDARDRARASADKTADFDSDSFAYKAADGMYFTKFGLLLAGAALLLWVFIGLARGL